MVQCGLVPMVLLEKVWVDSCDDWCFPQGNGTNQCSLTWGDFLPGKFLYGMHCNPASTAELAWGKFCQITCCEAYQVPCESVGLVWMCTSLWRPNLASASTEKGEFASVSLDWCRDLWRPREGGTGMSEGGGWQAVQWAHQPWEGALWPDPSPPPKQLWLTLGCSDVC